MFHTSTIEILRKIDGFKGTDIYNSKTRRKLFLAFLRRFTNWTIERHMRIFLIRIFLFVMTTNFPFIFLDKAILTFSFTFSTSKLLIKMIPSKDSLDKVASFPKSLSMVIRTHCISSAFFKTSKSGIPSNYSMAFTKILQEILNGFWNVFIYNKAHLKRLPPRLPGSWMRTKGRL